MLHLVESERAYGPETVAVMTAAFEKACEYVSPPTNGDDEAHRKLASIILRHVDRGERDPRQLALAALREWAGSDDLATGDR
jgi:hypothetical protein